MKVLITSLLILVSSVTASPLVIGEQLKVLLHDQERLVNVILPASYKSNLTSEFAIVILLDGGSRQWLLDAASAFDRTARRGLSEEVILVGIDTSGYRQRDLTPPVIASLENDDEHRGGGGAETFRNWLAEKVVPLIANRFRSDGRVFLIGHSLGGLFAIETLITGQLNVHGVAAVSPALWWNENAPLERAVSALPSHNALPPLFLADADEDPDLMTAVDTLRKVLGDHPSFCYEERPSQSHGTVFSSVLLEIGPCLWPIHDN